MGSRQERRGQDSSGDVSQVLLLLDFARVSRVIVLTYLCSTVIGCDHAFSPVVTSFASLRQTRDGPHRGESEILRVVPSVVADTSFSRGALMKSRRSRELAPRNGHTLVVGIVARISGCASQKDLSLDDQVDHGKEEIAELYSGPTEYRVIATTGKGEALDRPELAEIERMIRSDELDVLVMEDAGRLVRGIEAVRLWGTQGAAPRAYMTKRFNSSSAWMAFS